MDRIRQDGEDVLQAERSLGFWWPRGISRTGGRYKVPAIKALLDEITPVTDQYKTTLPNGIRASDDLRLQASIIFDVVGERVWPDPPVDRSAWVAKAGADNLMGDYPRDLYFSNGEDKEELRLRFHTMLVRKCISKYRNHAFHRASWISGVDDQEQEDEVYSGHDKKRSQPWDSTRSSKRTRTSSDASSLMIVLRAAPERLAQILEVRLPLSREAQREARARASQAIEAGPVEYRRRPDLGQFALLQGRAEMRGKVEDEAIHAPAVHSKASHAGIALTGTSCTGSSMARKEQPLSKKLTPTQLEGCIDLTSPDTKLIKPETIEEVDEAARRPIVRERLPEEHDPSPSIAVNPLEDIQVEIEWNRDIRAPDYMVLEDCSVDEFFKLLRTHLPPALEADGEKIKQVRVEVVSHAEGTVPRIDCRIPRGPQGRASLRQMLKKLRAAPDVESLEIKILVDWIE